MAGLRAWNPVTNIHSFWDPISPLVIDADVLLVLVCPLFCAYIAILVSPSELHQQRFLFIREG